MRPGLGSESRTWQHGEVPKATSAIIVLTGPPGSGKTTVAAILAGGSTPSVHLHTDDFWHFIRQGRIPPYLPEAHHQNEVVMDVLAGCALGYALGGYEVIVDGVIGPWFVEGFETAARTSGVPLHYIVLRADEETTLARAAGRDSGALTETGPVKAMYGQFADLGAFEPHVVDCTRLTAERTAETVRAGLHDGTFRLTGPPVA
jgi:predicted kinase